MERVKKSKFSNNNENNIEKQIFSMLENVLKEDSDDSIDSNYSKKKNNKSQQNRNRQNFNFINRERLDFPKIDLNLNQNHHRNLVMNNSNTHINSINPKINISQPQIFINNIPVSKEQDLNEKIDFNYRKNISSNKMCVQMPHFNNLSPISKHLKNQSPKNNIQDNLMTNQLQQPINNRLTVAHIGINMGYNNLIMHNSPKNNVTTHTFVRNNTINYCGSKPSISNINENNSSYVMINRY